MSDKRVPAESGRVSNGALGPQQQAVLRMDIGRGLEAEMPHRMGRHDEAGVASADDHDELMDAVVDQGDDFLRRHAPAAAGLGAEASDARDARIAFRRIVAIHTRNDEGPHCQLSLARIPLAANLS